jgi:hypothetical protein
MDLDELETKTNTVKVPINSTDPDSETIEIKMLRSMRKEPHKTGCNGELPSVRDMLFETADQKVKRSSGLLKGEACASFRTKFAMLNAGKRSEELVNGR